jgi:hypothetical protein
MGTEKFFNHFKVFVLGMLILGLCPNNLWAPSFIDKDGSGEEEEEEEEEGDGKKEKKGSKEEEGDGKKEKKGSEEKVSWGTRITALGKGFKDSASGLAEMGKSAVELAKSGNEALNEYTRMKEQGNCSDHCAQCGGKRPGTGGGGADAGYDRARTMCLSDLCRQTLGDSALKPCEQLFEKELESMEYGPKGADDKEGLGGDDRDEREGDGGLDFFKSPKTGDEEDNTEEEEEDSTEEEEEGDGKKEKTKPNQEAPDTDSKKDEADEEESSEKDASEDAEDENKGEEGGDQRTPRADSDEAAPAAANPEKSSSFSREDMGSSKHVTVIIRIPEHLAKRGLPQIEIRDLPRASDDDDSNELSASNVQVEQQIISSGTS